jgi:hypothetical protein
MFGGAEGKSHAIQYRHLGRSASTRDRTPPTSRLECPVSPTHQTSLDTVRTSTTRSLTVRPVLALIAFPVVGFGWALLYVSLISRVLDRGSLALAAAIVMLPVLGLAAGLLWIALVWGVERRTNRLGVVPRLLLTIPIALVLGLLLAGPRGFTLAPGAELFNVVLIIVLSTGALAYSWLARW